MGRPPSEFAEADLCDGYATARGIARARRTVSESGHRGARLGIVTVPGPPTTLPGTPQITTLPAGTVLRRIHGGFDADAFNSTAQPSRLAGGRFDSLDGGYAYVYLGADDDSAIAETLCRDLPLDGTARLVPRMRILGRRITSVEVVRNLNILMLHGAALTQVGAGLWLTKSGADQYEATRAWAARLLQLLPDIDGFEYRCRHDEDRMAWALFDDSHTAPGRAHGALRAKPDTRSLDSEAGLVDLERVLANHNAAVEPR
ncbi:MAG TPA: RES family NAD+ phosphorylase [Nocardioidaceae bacterium]|nr:RES family NAD+ phosphorylase [Nocardioidaceae bacterium]